jgi:predicted phosphodiesterase
LNFHFCEKATLAPVHAVRDHGAWSANLPVTHRIEIDGFRIYVPHILAELNPQAADNVDAVIYGHSHRPKIKTTNGTPFFNPGSAGPRRFRLPITVGRMTVVHDKLPPKSLSSALRIDSCGDAWDGCYRSATVTFVLTEFAMKQFSCAA